MVRRLLLDDRAVWMKSYGKERRRVSRAALAVCARGLDIPMLRPPPRHLGEQAKALELCRLTELRNAGVRVPEVIGEGTGLLLLSDVGHSLSRELRACANDSSRAALAVAPVDAIAGVHAAGQYLGQPVPRNLAVRDGKVAFIDFEEDPREVMSLREAQARDWLIFSHGMARHCRDSAALAVLLGRGLAQEPPEVAGLVRGAGARLRALETLLRPFGRRSRLAVALEALRLIALAAAFFGFALAIDFLWDGRVDLLA